MTDKLANTAALSVEKLRAVIDKALDDADYAERLFTDPAAIARENGLSADEELVVKQMNREQFTKARIDAASITGELSEADLSTVTGGIIAIAPQKVSTNMILGRSISYATGNSFSTLTAAGCECCAWKGSISAGGMVSNPNPG
ncbi:MAG: hypothetical protein JNM42_11055 [Propionivibrio sp.]|uniref:hypothetical protein n=1 Tax=Propionivibrio sp. TaxID=2212460 RepID=UPI001A637989|nr:hypothetical protein [Propionivibrio sp.]MBL8414965.1 hypothetical protein [Propionivibrio sp.]